MLQPQDYKAAAELIAKHKRIVVVPHANVDPDGISSALACFELFTALGKEVTVICPDTKPANLAFLPGYEHLEHTVKQSNNFVISINTEGGIEVDTLQYSIEDDRVDIVVTPKKGTLKAGSVTCKDAFSDYDLLCVVDTADLQLLGSFYTENKGLFEALPMLNIDHHSSNPKFGTTQLIDTTAASATEVLYHWFSSQEAWKKHISADMATLLLTGLITDTRSFQNPNTTPESLEVAAELLDLGARQQEIIQNIYKTKPLTTLKIWGRALHNIQIDNQAKLVWSTISKDDLHEMGATSKETGGILDELISTIPDADVHVLFTEREEGGLKASARSSEQVNVSDMANDLFGGGGHNRAAGFKILEYENFSLAVLKAVQSIKDWLTKAPQADSSSSKADDSGSVDVVKKLTS